MHLKFYQDNMYFRYIGIISSWKRARSFMWTNLKPRQPNALCLFELILALWFLRKRFLIVVTVFLQFHYNFRFEQT